MKKASYRGYVHIKRRLIVADRGADKSGFSWTLAAALGEMLLLSEDMFGPRNLSYTILGIDYSPDGPCTWTPGDCKHIIVLLDMNSLTDRQDAYLQLAHECIHLLSPTGKADANVLEEGLAVHFGQWYMEYIFGQGWWSGKINIRSYADALMFARQLLAIDPYIIKKIRKHHPIIAYITADQIIECCPTVPKELAVALARPFKNS